VVKVLKPNPFESEAIWIDAPNKEVVKRIDGTKQNAAKIRRKCRNKEEMHK
jgi:hypothetical protein